MRSRRSLKLRSGWSKSPAVALAIGAVFVISATAWADPTSNEGQGSATSEEASAGFPLVRDVGQEPISENDAYILGYYQEVVENLEPGDPQTVLNLCNFASVALRLRQFDLAETALMDAIALFEDEIFQESIGKQTAWTDDNESIFTGEIHEKAMMAFYAGLLQFRRGVYNEARIGFEHALRFDAHSVAKEYRDDMAIVHRMLGYSYLRVGNMDAARIAFQKYNEYSDPADHVTLEEAETHNLIAIFELGVAPFKEDDAWGAKKFKLVQYPETGVDVRLNRRRVGIADFGFDLYEQSITRGMSKKEKVQRNKSIAFSIVSLFDLGLISGVAMSSSRWSLADTRYWATLPCEIHILGLAVEPGEHTMEARYISEEGRPIGRMRYSVDFRLDEGMAPEDGILLFHSPSNDSLFSAPTEETDHNKNVTIRKKIGD